MGGSAPVAASIFVQRIVIGVGDMAVSNNTQLILSTYALGSCIAVVAYDAAVKAGGILHLMLPESAISPEKARNQPAMFADTGLPSFLNLLHGLRADRSRLRIFVTGGASMLGGNDPFRIGGRNTDATLCFLATHGYTVLRTETGGSINRTVHLELSSGGVSLKSPGANVEQSLAK
ncbi:MAG: chemotaxis protein CheD [Candidatus Didemnitutus sp.]|nr:chemotaxis protein CheD [Candidatus Didemnitutus sp.]